MAGNVTFTFPIGGTTREFAFKTKALAWIEKETGQHWTMHKHGESQPLTQHVALIRAGLIHTGKTPDDDTVYEWIDIMPEDGPGSLAALSDKIWNALVESLPPDRRRATRAEIDRIQRAQAEAQKAGAVPLDQPTGNNSAPTPAAQDATQSASGT